MRRIVSNKNKICILTSCSNASFEDNYVAWIHTAYSFLENCSVTHEIYLLFLGTHEGSLLGSQEPVIAPYPEQV
jgi:hypothetical protein